VSERFVYGFQTDLHFADASVVISMEAAGVVNAILLVYITFAVTPEEPQIGSPNPIIPIDNYCLDDKLHFAIQGGSRDYKAEVDQNDICNPIRFVSWGRRAGTELERLNMRTTTVGGEEGNGGDYAGADKEQES
jgi:hypothetical protein